MSSVAFPLLAWHAAHRSERVTSHVSCRYLLVMHFIVFVVGYYISHHHTCPKCAPLTKRMDPPSPPFK